MASSQNTILNFCIRDIIQNSKTYLTSLLAEAKRDFPHAVFEIVLAFFVFVFLLKIYFISCLLASDAEQDQNDCQKNLICALALKFFQSFKFRKPNHLHNSSKRDFRTRQVRTIPFYPELFISSATLFKIALLPFGSK